MIETMEPGERYHFGTSDAPGWELVIAIPPGQKQPAIIMRRVATDEFVVVGRFAGDKQACVVTQFLMTMALQINRAVEELEAKNTNKTEHAEHPHQGTDNDNKAD